MAILGKIRQRSIFLIIVIGMALFAFVISGVFDGNSPNNGPTDPIAIVNDEEIEIDFTIIFLIKFNFASCPEKITSTRHSINLEAFMQNQ